jgi:hypothetical protein
MEDQQIMSNNKETRMGKLSSRQINKTQHCKISILTDNSVRRNRVCNTADNNRANPHPQSSKSNSQNYAGYLLFQDPTKGKWNQISMPNCQYYSSDIFL